VRRHDLLRGGPSRLLLFEGNKDGAPSTVEGAEGKTSRLSPIEEMKTRDGKGKTWTEKTDGQEERSAGKKGGL